MGQFSYICSDTGRALLNTLGLEDYSLSHNRRTRDCCTASAFCLIPAEFGGGAFKVDHDYDGYGHFYDKDGKEVDVYEEMARWHGFVSSDQQESRCYAIDMVYNHPEKMKYPLKIVEVYRDYEKAEPSEDDPNQGWGFDDETEDDGWEDTDGEDFI